MEKTADVLVSIGALMIVGACVLDLIPLAIGGGVFGLVGIILACTAEIKSALEK